MRTSIIVSGLALVAALGACDSNTNSSVQNAVSATESAADNIGNATQNATDRLSNVAENAAQDARAAIKGTPTGQEFADAAGKSDAFEIEAAKVAQANAGSADVKRFAAMMIEAHTKSTAKVKAAGKAASPAIAPNPALTADQNDALAKLRGLKGADFDKAYVDGQVDAHKDALALMQAYAKNGTVPSLKTAAGEIAPVVETHLGEARALKR